MFLTCEHWKNLIVQKLRTHWPGWLYGFISMSWNMEMIRNRNLLIRARCFQHLSVQRWYIYFVCFLHIQYIFLVLTRKQFSVKLNGFRVCWTKLNKRTWNMRKALMSQILWQYKKNRNSKKNNNNNTHTKEQEVANYFISSYP